MKGLATLAFLILIFVVAESLATHSDKQNQASLTFSNTASWDPYYLGVEKEATRYPATLFTSISLPPPPANTSVETSNELKELEADVALRNTKEIQDILDEANPETTYLLGRLATDYMDGKKFPATAALLNDSFHDLTVITMQQKMKFDRVRPNVLDPNLTTVIPVPGHPAYPSGHSTQLHFIAYVLGELIPAQKEALIARADQIAKNREIAGLHYPSDTRGGVLLAQQFFAIMMQDKKFQTLLAAAKKEWQTSIPH